MEPQVLDKYIRLISNEESITYHIWALEVHSKRSEISFKNEYLSS